MDAPQSTLAGPPPAFVDNLLKWLQVIGIIVVAGWAMWTFGHESKKDYRSARLQIYNETLEAVGKMIDFAPTAESRGWSEATDRYWTLYYGRLIFVASPDVQAAADQIKDFITKTPPGPRNVEAFRQHSAVLAHAMKTTIDDAWRVP